MKRAWTEEEMEQLAAGVAAGKADAELSAELGRSVNAVGIRRRRFLPREPRDLTKSPGWQSGRPAGGRYWTPERIVAALRDYAKRQRGALPTSDHEYSRAKKDHLEWPTAQAVLAQFGTMADAWEAIGARKDRYSRSWVPWTQEDDDYLLEHAGEQTLKVVAKALGRSWGACKRRLYDLNAGRARDVAGYLSAMQVAKEYNCPLSRVKRLIASGELPAHRVVGGHYWRIAPEDCERLKHTLLSPKRTHTTTPASIGDYERRYGLRRVSIGGRIVRVPA